MPIYELECLKCGAKEEHFLEISNRDTAILCCNAKMSRLPGGHGMLHFEEGRQRVHIGLSDKPISSYAEQRKLMRLRGATETGNSVPTSILKAGDKSEAMKRHLSKDHKKWV